jgi:hypothetical protein
MEAKAKADADGWSVKSNAAMRAGVTYTLLGYEVLRILCGVDRVGI